MYPGENGYREPGELSTTFSREEKQAITQALTEVHDRTIGNARRSKFESTIRINTERARFLKELITRVREL